MALATITSKGQITIPKGVREKLMLGAGDKIEFIFTNEREALIRPVSKTVDDLFGKLSKPGRKAFSIKEINETVARKLKADLS